MVTFLPATCETGVEHERIGIAVNVDRASAAQSRAASEFRSGEFESVAEYPEQRGFRRDADLFFTSINAECKVGHVVVCPESPVVEFWNWTSWYSTREEREMADWRIHVLTESS